MDFVEGQNLDELVQRQGPMMCREAKRLAIELFDTLAYVHGKHILHRDIKPAYVGIKPCSSRASLCLDNIHLPPRPLISSNIMRRDSDSRFVLVDFGICHLVDAGASASERV
jgi:serine/threonine protein kinase